MNKDVIYIDVDDDITAIIGKVKASKERIIALVPPKRIGVLQSAVNLRLLDRMAKTGKKQLVIITNNQALIALTASAHIPTARNLQSKPEIAEIPALSVDDDDDIIDGADLPVADHIKSAGQDEKVLDKPKKQSRDDAVETLAIDGEEIAIEEKDDATEAVIGAKAIKSTAKSKSKIPNFNSFRKRVFLIVTGLVGLTALLIWMFIFAPAATVVITARTAPSPVSTSVKLAGTAATDYEKGQVKSLSEELKKDESIEFEATGQKNVGDKASGTMELTRTSISSEAFTVASGTEFTANGITFISTEAATLEGTSIGPGGIIQDSATVAVIASKAGEDHNVSAQGYQPSSSGYTAYGSNMAGGTTKMARVVTAADVERARGDLIGGSTDDAKSDLTTKFGDDVIVIEDSFATKRGTVASSPAVGKEVVEGQKAKLTASTTYTMYAVQRQELESYLKANLESRIAGSNGQQVYDSGIESAELGNFKKSGEELSVSLTATGQIGPQIDEPAVKELVKGKIAGDVQSTLEAIDGIQDVSVRYPYFWVRTVPNDTNKIQLEFKLEEHDN